MSLFSSTVVCLLHMYTPSWECRSFVCMHLAHEILMKSMTSTSLLLLDSLGNPFRAISRILSPQKSLAVKISFTVVEYITYTNSPQEKKNLLLDIFEYINEMGSCIIDVICASFQSAFGLPI